MELEIMEDKLEEVDYIGPGGWVKVHRKLLSWQWISSPNHVAVFLNILLHANYKESKWRSETIRPGQLLTGRKQLMDWTGLSEKQIRKCLEDLEKSKEIGRRRTNQFSIITILKWDEYQGDDKNRADGGQSEGKSKGSPRATSKKVNKYKKEKNNTVVTGFFEKEQSQELDELPASELAIKVLTALNTICFTGFRPGKTTLSFINARIKEKYTYEDFVAVITHRKELWANNPKMQEFLRPKTLFNSENFDGYLQAAKNALKPKTDPLDAFFEQYTKEGA